MLLYRGLAPSLIIAAALLMPQLAPAQHAIPLTLAEAERLALDHEPGRAAMLERAAALDDRAVAAGQLPDPSMRIGVANYPIGSGSFSTEAMTQAVLGYRQSFPSGRSRTFSTAKFESLADGMTADAEARERDVRMRVRVAWLDAYYWQRAHDIVTESRPFFADLVEVTRSLYSVGRKTQHDVLRADLELSLLDDRLIEVDRNLGLARARLSEWLGEEAARPVAPVRPGWDALPALGLLEEGLVAHPAMAAAAARIDAGDAGVAVAEEAKKPGWALDVGYGYREGYLATGEPRSDFVSVSVSLDLPFFRKNRQDRMLAAALRERSASRYERLELERSLNSQLAADFSRWQDLTRRLDLFESQILVMSASRAEAAMLAYQSDAGDFADVMRATIDDLNTRLDYVRLQVERDKTYAALANLGGLTR